MISQRRHSSTTKLTGHRTDKMQKFSEKVMAVNDILAGDVK